MCLMIVFLLFVKKKVELWKKFIAFEKSNPLRTEDTALITRRVMFATEQCLLVLTHHPAVWHQAAQFLDQSSKALADKGVRIVFLYKISQFQLITLNHRYQCTGYQQHQKHTVKLLLWTLSIIMHATLLIKQSINNKTFKSYLSKKNSKKMVLFISFKQNCHDDNLY